MWDWSHLNLPQHPLSSGQTLPPPLLRAHKPYELSLTWNQLTNNPEDLTFSKRIKRRMYNKPSKEVDSFHCFTWDKYKSVYNLTTLHRGGQKLGRAFKIPASVWFWGTCGCDYVELINYILLIYLFFCMKRVISLWRFIEIMHLKSLPTMLSAA